MLSKIVFKQETREKKAFYPTDFNKPVLDIYYGFKGVEPSNPIQWYDTLKFGAGNGVEDAMVDRLKESGIVQEDYDQKEHGRIEIQREGVQINGYIDAITIEGLPIEIKSINNKNSFDIKRYDAGEPKENYVGQLSIYMDALGVDTGYLFASTIDGLHRYWFECKRLDNGKFKCANIEVDIQAQYKRWGRLFKENIEKDIEPQPFEVMYKYPVEEIDWRSLKQYQIANARGNRAVIGDWEITYSPWKDMIIKKQGAELGYSKKELEYIKEATQGYTTWFKKKIWKK